MAGQSALAVGRLRPDSDERQIFLNSLIDRDRQWGQTWGNLLVGWVGKLEILVLLFSRHYGGANGPGFHSSSGDKNRGRTHLREKLTERKKCGTSGKVYKNQDAEVGSVVYFIYRVDVVSGIGNGKLRKQALGARTARRGFQGGTDDREGLMTETPRKQRRFGVADNLNERSRKGRPPGLTPQTLQARPPSLGAILLVGGAFGIEGDGTWEGKTGISRLTLNSQLACKRRAWSVSRSNAQEVGHLEWYRKAAVLGASQFCDLSCLFVDGIPLLFPFVPRLTILSVDLLPYTLDKSPTSPPPMEAPPPPPPHLEELVEGELLEVGNLRETCTGGHPLL
ncbi:hypothetical protein BDK51DRAFT_29619 [Blyttiomyces helicus]|uniref:Uncharacterized protein n=1 Tax=Blyttiomyces helicus TaxID=388810 RepID=A0A4P9WPZ0_9FUNG|nr:hypothetical protein BDK51DRAFT_29619 [Blyttiomyces helicus]|eukprot:RKO94415.1 hypothetical protein BDK51DRAFT_29619 [Blyttiomyces helicus]